MKRSIALLAFLIPLFAGAQSSLLNELMATSCSGDVTAASENIREFEDDLKNRKRGTSDFTFLKAIFTKTQQKFLKHYSQYTDLHEIFSTGKYDCLTATGLFSVLLSDLGFQYRIIETNYHIFLLVQTEKGEVLLETTDRFNGFVAGKDDIENRLGSYKKNLLTADAGAGKVYHTYHFSLYQDVHPNQLTGLLFYNQAVKAFNNKELLTSAELLNKSRALYDSPRVAELAVMITESVLDSNLSEDTKLLILKRYKNYWEQRSRLMAIR